MGAVDGMVVLVTGGARGIGAGTARALAREGAAVAVCDLERSALEAVDEALAGVGAAHAVSVCDVTDRGQVDNWVADTAERFGGIDGLVNSAAFTGFELTGVESFSTEQLRQHIEVDVIGTLHCMQACFEHLRARGGGAIVNFASNAGTNGYVNETGYAVAKEGVRGLTKVASTEWGQHGIAVNVVCPTSRTEALDAFFAQQPPETEERLRMAVPMRRIGDPETDIGEAVVALLSPLSRYISGRTIFVDGGRGSYR